MTNAYRATTGVPPLVQQAHAHARKTGFTQSCTDETGRLLRVLASQVRGDGIIGEIGTGCGVGAAWIISGLAPGVRFVTIEVDAVRAEAARTLFAPFPDVTVRTGDWRELLPHGPFALLFADGGKAKVEGADDLRRALAPGGTIMLDDLGPEDQWPPEWRGQRDPVRDYWLNHPGLIAVELLTTPTSCVILAVPVSANVTTPKPAR